VSQEVTFSRSLYLPSAIESAIEAYADLARFETGDAGDDVRVTITDVADGVESYLVDEFCNHVLMETIVQRGSAEVGP